MLSCTTITHCTTKQPFIIHRHHSPTHSPHTTAFRHPSPFVTTIQLHVISNSTTIRKEWRKTNENQVFNLLVLFYFYIYHSAAHWSTLESCMSQHTPLEIGWYNDGTLEATDSSKPCQEIDQPNLKQRSSVSWNSLGKWVASKFLNQHYITTIQK